jgi:hypothetical protein
MYSLTLQFTDNIYFQDRLRFRLEDFKNCFVSYQQFRGLDLISKSDYIYIENTIYRDPHVHSKSKQRPVSDTFKKYFNNICDIDVMNELWSFSTDYIQLLIDYSANISENMISDNDEPLMNKLPSIISYLVTKFYSADRMNEFYEYILSWHPKIYQTIQNYFNYLPK